MIFLVGKTTICTLISNASLLIFFFLFRYNYWFYINILSFKNGRVTKGNCIRFSIHKWRTPSNSEIICGQNVGTKVVCGIIFFLEKKAMLKIWKISWLPFRSYSYNSIKRTCSIKRPGLDFFKKSLLNVPYYHKTACRKQLNVLLY